MFTSSVGPVKDAKTAKAYLASKSWFLQEEQLNLAKFSRILLTALLIKGIPPEVQTVVKAVAYAIEDAASDSLAEFIASKTADALSTSLTPNTDLLAAIAKDHADTLVKAKDVAKQKSDLLHKLESLHDKVNSTSNMDLPPAKPSWAQITAAPTPTLPSPSSLEEMKTLQRVALATRCLLITIDPSDPLFPNVG
jgi:hypothetical protein